MEETDNVCKSCGKESGKKEDKNNNTQSEVKKKSFKPKLIIIIIALIVAAIAAVVLVFMFKGSYKRPIENLCNALEDGDDDDFYDALPPYVTDALSDKKRRIIRNNLKIAMLTMENKCGEDIEVSYNIMEDDGVEKLEDDVLGKLEKSINKEYKEDVTVSKGYTVTLKVNIKGDEQKISSPYFTVNVYNINGRWYVEDRDAAEAFISQASSVDLESSPINDLIDEII